MKSNVIRRYKCSESELYSIAETAWTSYLMHLADFTSMKPYYTQAFGEAALEAIDAAQLLPDMYARKEMPVSTRIALQSKVNAALFQFLTLKSYIRTRYPKILFKIKYEAAGGRDYVLASKFDWEKAVGVLTAGQSFMIKYETELSENNNMPGTFAAVYNNAMNEFVSLYNEYKMMEGVSAGKTDEKRNANNEVLQAMMEMLKDAQLIFKSRPTIKQLFTYTKIARLVSSSGPAGLKGVIKNEHTGAMLGGVVLSLHDEEDTQVPHYTCITNESGAYDFGNIASGTYTLKMEHASFTTREEVVDIFAGVSSRKNFVLRE